VALVVLLDDFRGGHCAGISKQRIGVEGAFEEVDPVVGVRIGGIAGEDGVAGFRSEVDEPPRGNGGGLLGIGDAGGASLK